MHSEERKAGTVPACSSRDLGSVLCPVTDLCATLGKSLCLSLCLSSPSVQWGSQHCPASQEDTDIKDCEDLRHSGDGADTCHS